MMNCDAIRIILFDNHIDAIIKSHSVMQSYFDQSCKRANKYSSEPKNISLNPKTDLKPKPGPKKHENYGKLDLKNVCNYCSYKVKINLLIANKL